MKTITTRITSLLMVFLAAVLFNAAKAQTGVLNPDDPIVVYSAANPPATPPYGTLAKWVKTNRVSFTTTSFKAYFYKGVAFRLKFPKTYKDSLSNPNKKYPIFVFFHGIGEKGTIYDNEYQLYHGGQRFRDYVDNGSFDGFLLYMQSSSGSGAFNATHYQLVNELINNYFVPQVKVDINRVIVDGLSGGGGATWQMLTNYPRLVAAGMPISGVAVADADNSTIQSLKFTPIWLFQGGLDTRPDPNTAHYVQNAYLNAGSNFSYTEWPTLGHGCWNQSWALSTFTPYMNAAHKANPWPLFGRTEFCPGDPISQVIGVTAGFDGYEWSKDGVTIPGATGNTYTATSIGTYACRIRRGAEWSPWSPKPVVIKLKGATISPDIQPNGFFSNVIPAPDGSTVVPLAVPEGYTSYNWQKDGDPTVLSTTRLLNASSPGYYKVKVTEQFGCSSEFSNLYHVVDANGPNGPPTASSVIASAISKTAIRLDWAQNPSPAFNETGFEIYSAPAAGGPYKLIVVTAADAITYTHNDLNPNTDYFYKIRAINNTGASSTTAAVTAKTLADGSAPTAPGNLRTAGSTRNSVNLIWDESTDDVGVFKYDIYVNGVKFYESDVAQATVFNLQHGQTYAFRVQARDFAGNKSPYSNQVTGQALLNGLNYKYYTFTGTWNALANFTTLEPDATGVVPNITLNNRTQDDNFAYLWEGFITIPTTGNYNFRTNSDDGSRLWLGPLNGTTSPYSFAGTPTVNNDGLHGSQNATSSTMALTAGVYPIAIAFYEQSGGESMTISWRLNSGSYSTIPTSAFQDPPVVKGTAPLKPGPLTATTVSYKQINLSWSDLSNNETGFEVWRSPDGLATTFEIVGSTAAGVTTFSDSVGLAPSTRYFYQVRSIGQYGESAFVPATGSYSDAQAHWRFNNDYNDASGNNRTITGNNTPTFSTDAEEGSHSVEMNGSNEDITVNTSSGDYLRGGYNAKSVVFWMQADANGGTGLFDFGGSDDGLAMRLNAGQLLAGVASNNTRRQITATYNGTSWNHVALVYNAATLRLYLNGVEVASNTSLGFTSVTSTSDASMIGDDNGTTALNVGFAQYDGKMDNFAVFGRALTQPEIASMMANTYGTVNAVTLALPAAPAAPSSLVASGVSTSAINVTWNDNSANEARFELFRSANNNSNFILYKTLAPNTTSFQDTSLFSNSIFYYKVRAANEGGNSGESNQDSAKTFNNAPELTAIDNQFMRFGTQLVLNVTATDADPEVLTTQVTNLPSFGVYAPTGNGTGTITFNPTVAHVGFYNDITVQVTDEHGGVVTTVFDLTVNSNDNPVVSSASDVVLNEQQTGQVNFTATDANVTDVLTWSFTNLPSFATPVTGTNSVQINLAPGYAANGVYHVGVRVDDGNDGFDTTSFNITVNDVNPNKTIYVHFNDGSINAPAPWNNTGKVPALNDNFPNLKDDVGTTTTVGVQLTSAFTGANNLGANTGSNSGIYPDAVLRSSYFTGTGAAKTVRVYGLNTGDSYTFTFLGSRANPTVGVTATYSIGAQSVSLNASNNTANTVSISDVVPAPDGSVVISVAAAASSSFGYLNSIVIRSLYDDGTAPAKPRNLAAETFNSNVRLTWVDAAYNEQSYEVYRSTSLGGSYTLLNPGGGNAGLQQYDDANVQGHTTYYYFVKALNSVGSTNSDTVAFETPNTAPVLTPIANVNMAIQQVLDINVTATDEPGETITLSATGLPAFATFTDNHNGTGVIHIAPGNTSGQFNNITITATDNSNASSSDQFNISVTNPNVSYTYVNFNQTLPAAAPWNNMNSAPTVNATIPNLLDNAGVATGASVTLLDAWTGQTATGFTTGNNSGLYPDNVMVTSYYYSSTANSRRVRLSGLNTTKRYNLIFFASRNNYATPLTTRYTVGAQSVDLNAQNNTSTTAQLNDLAPDVNGEILISAQAVVGPNAYIGALVIQAYTPDLNNPVAPANLTATGISKTQISLSWGTTANTGYEVWRSTTGATGTYTKRADIPANTTTYTDNGLTAATVYHYKVKSVINGTPSPFSNYAGASTVAYTILLNMNDGTAGAPAQGGNWNNTNALIADGYILPDMINDQGQNTGIDFNVVTSFSGFNYSGTVTGNNSGVYPDNTMKSFYYCNFADTARLKITGLTLAHAYNFVFFGSRANPLVGVITAYQIGSKVVTLNAANNTQNVIKITGLIPEADGSISIKIYGTTSGGFGYLNVFSIEGAPAVASEGGSMMRTTNPGTGTVTPETAQTQARRPAPEAVIDPVGAADIYPNPFVDDVTLKFELKENVSRFTIAVLDLSGRIVYQREVSNATKGTFIQKLGINGQKLGKGVYLVRVLGIPGHEGKDLKLMRQ